MIKISGDYSGIDRELDRLANLAEDAATRVRLDAALEVAFQETQAAVHVQTGSLKGSGKRDSEVERDVWAGEIRYGGTSTGPKPYVSYAREEMERDNGEHNFFANLHLVNSEFEDAIVSALRGDL